jgi:hypothetical protein
VPLVISRKKAFVHFVRSEEALAEILLEGSLSDHDWAIGDRLVFEDGTESVILRNPDGTGHIWGNPVKPANLADVGQAVGRPDPQSWQELFASFKGSPGTIG